jgi:hypothetical protein
MVAVRQRKEEYKKCLILRCLMSDFLKSDITTSDISDYKPGAQLILDFY